MINKLKTRMNSDSADSLTVAQILQIAFVVVLVIAVGQMIYSSVSAKGKAVADCIDQSNTLFTGKGSTCMDSKGT